jgi:hypothetical protein
MLDLIVQYEIEEMIDYVGEGDVIGVEAPPRAFIVIWAPAREKRDEEMYNWLDMEHPKRVWWHENGQLVVREDRLKAIADYQRDHIENSPEEASIFAWGHYAFGIVSLSGGKQEAEVYLAASCGRLCGHGVLFTLQRNSKGVWSIVRDRLLWVS